MSSPRSLTESEIEALVMRVRANDVDAFRQLFDAWYAPLVTLAFQYVRSSDAAQDIAQEALAGFWNVRHSWQWTGSAFRYVQLVVRRRAIKTLRHDAVAARHGAQFVADDTSPGSGVAPLSSDVTFERRELWHAVSQALQSLPPRMRAVAVLRWIEGASRSEVAEELGISVRTVDAQLGLAAKAAREWLTARGHESPFSDGAPTA